MTTPTRCPKCGSTNIKNTLNLMTGANRYVCAQCGNPDFSPGDRTVASVLLDAQPTFRVAPSLPTLAELVPRYVEALIRSGDIVERWQKKAAKVDADAGRRSDPAIVYRDANHAIVMLAVDLAKETRKQLKKEADDEE